MTRPASLQLWSTAINRVLLLEPWIAELECHHNMDGLTAAAIRLAQNTPEEALKLLQRAANLCEKFHSYLHFEESYLHLAQAQHAHRHPADYGPEAAITSYLLAIKLDHQNGTAYQGLLQCYRANGADDLAADLQNQALSYGLALASPANQSLDTARDIPPTYSRPYSSFAEYLAFALDLSQNTEIEQPTSLHPKPAQPPIDSFWAYLTEYMEGVESGTKARNPALLTAALSDLQDRHRCYHRQAAMIYDNLAQLYMSLGEESLAIATRQRACNLDLSFESATQKAEHKLPKML